MAQTVENSPAVQEIWVQSLGWEEPLEKGMTTHASVRVSEIPWTEEPGGLQSVGSQSRAWLSDYTFRTFTPNIYRDELFSHVFGSWPT